MSIIILDNKTGLPYDTVISITHVIPCNDTIKHIPDSSCKCGHFNEMVGDDIVVKHHAMDGRLELEELTGIGVIGKGWIQIYMTTLEGLKTKPQPDNNSN